MRRLSLLLLQLVLFGGAAYGLSLVDGTRFLEPGKAIAAIGSIDYFASETIEPPAHLEVPAATIRPAASAIDTFLGMSDALLSERMRTGEVKSIQFNRGGSSISFRVDFADGSRAAFKPAQTNPQTVGRKEAASYRLSRLLGINLVAPVIMRSMRRDEILGKLVGSSWARQRIESETIFDEHGETYGSFAYWIPAVADLHLDTNEGVNRWTGWLSQGHDIPPEKAGLLAQLSTLLLFDLLQNNSDRFSGGNLLGSADGRTLYYMDNAFGFQPDSDGNLRCWYYLKRSQRFSRSMMRAMELLGRESLTAAMASESGPPLLSDEEIAAILSRRDRALAYVRSLGNEYGTDQVLVFP